MKKVLSIILISLTMPAMAQHHHGMRHFDHHQHRQSNWGWVAPAVIGGAVVYGLTRSAPVIVQQPPTYIQQPPTYIQQPPTYIQRPEIVVIDGVTYIKQYQIINGVLTEILTK
jgi:hypothetical protein